MKNLPIKTQTAPHQIDQDIWLYIKLPQLAIEAVVANTTILLKEVPAAVARSYKNAQRIDCCNQSAAAWGVDPLMSVSTALAICPDLTVLAKNVQQEQQLLQQLALQFLRYDRNIQH